MSRFKEIHGGRERNEKVMAEGKKWTHDGRERCTQSVEGQREKEDVRLESGSEERVRK